MSRMAKKQNRKVVLPPIVLGALVLIPLISLYSLGRQSLVNKAQEEKIVPSQWVPVNVADLNDASHRRIAALRNLREETISAERRRRAIEVETLLIWERGEMDENTDGVIDYLEFNKRTREVASKVYSLRHLVDQNKARGILNSAGNPVLVDRLLPPMGPVLIVLVENDLVNDISKSIEVYKNDVKRDWGFNTEVYTCNGCESVDVRSLLQKRKARGALFVGDLPAAWYLATGCFGDGEYREVFPIDLYFTDLDGSWGGLASCDSSANNSQQCYTIHKGNTLPEIFLGRVTSPSESEEVAFIKSYFARNHAYRTGIAEIPTPASSLIYVDDDWAGWAKSWGVEIATAFKKQLVVYDGKITSATDYKVRLGQAYNHLLIASHSSPWWHQFRIPSGNSFFMYNDIIENPVTVNFYNLFACASARYTEDDYMAGWYVLKRDGNGLLAVGSSKTGAMFGFSYFYRPLAEGTSFGEAMKSWYRNYTESGDECWHGGMTVIGDPTLRVSLSKLK